MSSGFLTRTNSYNTTSFRCVWCWMGMRSSFLPSASGTCIERWLPGYGAGPASAAPSAAQNANADYSIRPWAWAVASRPIDAWLKAAHGTQPLASRVQIFIDSSFAQNFLLVLSMFTLADEPKPLSPRRRQAPVAVMHEASTPAGKHDTKRTVSPRTLQNAERGAPGGHNPHKVRNAYNVHIAYKSGAVTDPRQRGESDLRHVATAAVVGQTCWNQYGLGERCQPPKSSSAFRTRASRQVSRPSSYGAPWELIKPRVRTSTPIPYVIGFLQERVSIQQLGTNLSYVTQHFFHDSMIMLDETVGLSMYPLLFPSKRRHKPPPEN
ncbi:uncharacterized protein BBA_09529 [Beauveria bassiana ARSEF 2860]|uniref:Uncharacterized protein n=1 Tax=Beauveria bassiana (strain ARSEF 2860) TaxID=655819 RepID=J4VSC7_BEAB2|nr:uncharacterized protein BBA_09529 [Beauveria bassiana ARSEF 2860]EJP61505.1 hypothetical protein BBA_09529 [Beauveria bassiana ARSEF 2860]